MADTGPRNETEEALAQRDAYRAAIEQESADALAHRLCAMRENQIVLRAELAEAAIARAKKIHRRSLFPATSGEHRGKYYCPACTYADDGWTAYALWPCATAVALGTAETDGEGPSEDDVEADGVVRDWLTDVLRDAFLHRMVVCEHTQILEFQRLAEDILGMPNAGPEEQRVEILVSEPDQEPPPTEAERLRAHILDIAAHATPYADLPEDPGYVGVYLVTAGALHRALGNIGHTAPSCEAEAINAQVREHLQKAFDHNRRGSNSDVTDELTHALRLMGGDRD